MIFDILFNHRIIEDECNPHLGPLMVRYFITPHRGLPFAIYLHHFLRSDDDRYFHDHPWSFISVILKGGYIEHQPNGVFKRRVGSILWRSAEWKHWVETENSWSLVIRMKRRRVWGFHTEEGFVPFDKYDCRGD